MKNRLFGSLGVFFLLGGGSFYTISSSLTSVGVDSSFYENSDLLSRFEKTDSVFKNSIDHDELKVRDYLLNSSFNLYFKQEQQEQQEHMANAFLLNILFPSDMSENDPGRMSYVPQHYALGDELVFLLGTSLKFVRKVLNVLNKNKNKNKNENENTVKFLDNANNANNANNAKLYLSHPYPALQENKNNSRLTQDYLYRLDAEEGSYVHRDFGLSKSYLFKLNLSDVELVYEARDLKVNKDLLGISLNTYGSLENHMKNIHRGSSGENWAEEISIIGGEKYKFFVDFAVLKVKVRMQDLRNPFLSYMLRLYRKEDRLPAILRDEIYITDGKTSPIYMGGWSSLSKLEREYHTMDNLFIKAETKEETKAETKASECTNPDLKLYETYSKLNSSSNDSNESNEFEVGTKTLHPNDSAGVLYIKFKIKKKNGEGTELPYEKVAIITGFKKIDTNATEDKYIEDYIKEKQIKDEKLVEFLELKPKAVAKWNEAEVKHAYFPFTDIKQQLLNSYLFSGSYNDLVYEFGGQKYLDIGHQLDVPNLDLPEAAGMVALTKHPRRNERVILGMYTGAHSWSNPFSQKRSVGKITMFISPWRYDLFNENNKLSKPSLADALSKKKLKNRIIHTNRFYFSKSQKPEVR